MAGEVVVDALPYIDQGYDEPGVREGAVDVVIGGLRLTTLALALVDEETRRYRPTKNYLEHLPQISLHAFETELMKNEFERLQQRLPMDTLSMKRYELPPPPAAKMSDLAAWNECVENSMAQLEHQATRICNLELMLEFGCEAWRSYIELLMRCLTMAQKHLQGIRKEIQEINWQRKHSQTKAGDKLTKLESMWQDLVKKNYEIEQACIELEKGLSEEQRRLIEEEYPVH